jgi:hypothetical protein
MTRYGRSLAITYAVVILILMGGACQAADISDEKTDEVSSSVTATPEPSHTFVSGEATAVVQTWLIQHTQTLVGQVIGDCLSWYLRVESQFEERQLSKGVWLVTARYKLFADSPEQVISWEVFEQTVSVRQRDGFDPCLT